MEKPKTRPSWNRGAAGLLIGAVGITLLLLISMPVLSPKKPVPDPAADAEAAYQSLLARVTVEEGLPETPAGPGESSPADASPAAAADSATGGAGDSTPPEDRLVRDLFSRSSYTPPRATAAARPTTQAPLPPAPPRLTGILIDGSARRAVLSGRVVAIGDEVGGFRVLAIEPGRVRLQRDETTYTLELKERP
jgi:hypothetical protein